ncbi:MAG: hypothetical protein GX061_06555 [Eubacteriaceae bacterium]|nr:hypothetical protein [Eubacteriaceae bacterium]
MIKFKPAMLYILTVMLFILLFASFDAEFYFDFSGRFDISREMMYRAFTENTAGLVTELPPVPDTLPAAEYSYGDENDTVASYKRKLYYLGYIKDYPEDKLMDEDMVSAVRIYQSDKALSISGTLNTLTMDTLDYEVVTYKQGVRGEDVTEYKEILRQLGYYGEQDILTDEFDEQMTEAVKTYQTDNSLEATGELDVFTLFLLMTSTTPEE